MKYLVLAVYIILCGCATTPTKLSVPIKCQDKRLPAEPFPDTPKAIADIPKGDLEDLVKLIIKGRVIRDQRLAEDDAQIAACTK